MTPDIQYFAVSGAWVKPAGAVDVDVLMCAAPGGLALGYGGGKYMIGTDGELTVRRFPAGELPEGINCLGWQRRPTQRFERVCADRHPPRRPGRRRAAAPREARVGS